MWLALLSVALASPSPVRGEKPTRATIRATERSFECEPTDWTLLRNDESGASFTVDLCGVQQTLTIRRVGRAWGFHTDASLRKQAPLELGCTDLEYEMIDVETRRVRGCGFEAVYHDAGMAGWRRQGEAAGYAEVSLPLVLGGEPVLGNPEAPFVVVDYTDFGCPGCAASFSALRELTFDPKVQVRSRLFPLDTSCNPAVQRPSQPAVCEAAYAALCAHQQGHYWEYAASLYAHPSELGEELFARLASELDLDVAAFAACRADPATHAAVAADAASGAALQLSHLPARFVRGLRGEAWVETCVEPAKIAAMIRAAEGGAVLPSSPATSCVP